MRPSLTKIAAVSLTALALGLGTVAMTTPASAAMWHGGGGWHGGGWHGGGWHGGGWRGGWRGPGWGAGALAAGAIAGAALAAPYYYGGYDGYGSCVSYQPMYDAYGNYVGQQAVNVC